MRLGGRDSKLEDIFKVNFTQRATKKKQVQNFSLSLLIPAIVDNEQSQLRNNFNKWLKMEVNQKLSVRPSTSSGYE